MSKEYRVTAYVNGKWVKVGKTLSIIRSFSRREQAQEYMEELRQYLEETHSKFYEGAPLRVEVREVTDWEEV